MAVVLSISSQVVRGHVGNSAAGFALARLGHDVWPLPSVVLAHHPGHNRQAPRLVTPAPMIGDVIESFDRNGWLGQIDAVLVGYLASAEQLAPIAEAIAGIRDKRPDALIAVDPVIGDSGRLYVDPAIADGLRDHILPLGQIATPNGFELSWLTGKPATTIEQAIAAARALSADEVLVTSPPGTDNDKAATLVVSDEGVWLAETSHLDHEVHGAGDLMSALYLGHRLNRAPPDTALARAVAGVFAVLTETARTSADELALTAAQDRLSGEPAGVRLVKLG